MNYQRIYNELINNRKSNPHNKSIYTEKHHIIPKSHGGDNSPDNLVRLSAREHFIAHWLLWRIHRDSKMAFAFNYMRTMSRHISNRYINSYGFEEARKAFVSNMNKNGRIISIEVRKKMAASRIGGKRTIETKQKMSEARKGKMKSDEHKKNMSESFRRRPPVVCPNCGKTGAKAPMIRHHFDNCKVTSAYD